MQRRFSLDDKYVLEEGVAYMSGIQALVRLPIEQMRRDRRKGLRTGAFISGYEGSPLGGYDLALQRVGKLLAEHNIHFVPGVNEDLAAAAVMGSQTFQMLPNPKVDGVVGIWYGKGPGVDRSGDALRHANLAGTGKHCGALALAGDDHVSKSSTIPHQSELALFSAAIPVFTAGNTQEVLDYGLTGIALSRYAGVWSALKLTTDICDGGGAVELSPERCDTVEPDLVIDGKPYEKVMNGMLIIPISLQLEQELFHHRLLAAREFARVNGVNQIKMRHESDRLGIITAGKSYYDLMSALGNLGLTADELAQDGVRILKLGLVYPLEPTIIEEFIAGLETVLVIEEKRSFIEFQLSELLINSRQRPLIFGKNGPDGKPLFPAHGELDAEIIARGVARWLTRTAGIERRLEKIAAIEKRSADKKAVPTRAPTYCSGCPHNRSTYLLEGQVALGGIGCHGMAVLLNKAQRGILNISQMGSDGASWIGMTPFTERRHVFQNIGDGTYFHSGRQAVLAAIASGITLTYKILYNGTVAMTGGQDIVGGLPIPALTRGLQADGVRRIIVLTDDLSRYEDRSQLAEGVEVRPREELERTLAELEREPGVTVMIYDQMCAAEKRRQRSRGLLPQPVRRMMIHERVCEGCGDCVSKSNCVSLHPVQTEFGPKTRIHQSSCNTDYTCALGDCPSFVSVLIEEGTGLKRRLLPDLPEAVVPEPVHKVGLEGSYHILMPGIGGTGVVTVNAVLATAALLEARHVITLDQTGMAQKGGAVVSHLTISPVAVEAANRLSYGAANLLLGFDVMGAAAADNLKRVDPSITTAVVNSHETPTADSIRRGLTVLSTDVHFVDVISRHTRSDRSIFVDASKLAEALFGGHMHTNVFLLGVAYQAGLVPLRTASIEQAIELNGVAAQRNLAAFRWGRKYVDDPQSVWQYAGEKEAAEQAPALDALVDRRVEELTLYQDAAYAQEYRKFVDDVARAETRARPGSTQLAETVARSLHKLMAYKDEYEVARLLTEGSFDEEMRETFEAPVKVVYHLHPPLLRSLGMKKKLALGPWARPLLRLLARLKFVRGTALDLFGLAEVRRQERDLIDWYKQALRPFVTDLHARNFSLAVEIAALPEQIRGYEQIKLRSIERVKDEMGRKLTAAARQTAA